jgi:hypothetical protein
VADRQNEAVTADPLVIRWVMAHYLVEEQVGNRRQRNRSSRVAIANFFNGICG